MEEDHVVTARQQRVKIVVVFDAMMSGLPTHKEDITGYSFLPIIQCTCQVAALKEDGCPKV
ncbi:hypothetical protein JHK82_018883 [Glycine max]|nr:hypothetical protein JHK85_019325 [Glycine max]KAG5038064.1 hypothetical protein JHK86_018904 [Glycine max]KAG5143188.1 hypothetical protein JHK82_018883 [Glycine max]